MIDIQIINDAHVRMEKIMWHQSELLIAQCYNFSVSEDNRTITADIKSTSKRALYEFIKLSFKNFSESVSESPRRTVFFEKLDYIYHVAYKFVDDIMRNVLPYYSQLFQHQREGIYECFYKQNNFLAYEMGLGKTITAASISRTLGISRTVVVCPAAVKFNWYRDLTDKFGYNPIYFSMMDASKRRSWRALQERFVICNYDIIGKHTDEIAASDIGHFIFDEAHYLKNHNTGRTKAIIELTEQFPHARKTLLSGTPIANRVNDIFAYMKITNHKLGENHKRFLDEYTVITKNRNTERVTGGKNLQDLHIKLANFMIRKTKDECLDLPDKRYISYRYELDDYKEEYNKIIDELSKQKSISALSSNLHSLNIVTSKAKIKGIVEIANSIIDEGRKVVIFGGYKEPLNMLAEIFGPSCVKIDGSVESYMRDQLVQQFINDPDCKVFLGNYDAAGVGINLVNASDIIFINFPFTPAKLYQAIDRCHRIGQDQSVLIHYTFCDESIDQYIYDIIIDKEEDINAVIDQGKEVILRENTIEILIKKLLKRDDIVFETNFSKAHDKDPGKTAIEAANIETGWNTGPGITQSQTDPGGDEDASRLFGSESAGRGLLDESIPVDKEVQPSSVAGGKVLPVADSGEAKGDGPIAYESVSGKSSIAYHLVLLEAINSMVILNDTEYKEDKHGPHKLLFSHADVTEVIKELRHRRLTFTGHATEKYTPMMKWAYTPKYYLMLDETSSSLVIFDEDEFNKCQADQCCSEVHLMVFSHPDLDVVRMEKSKRVILTDNGAIIQNTPEEIQKLSEIVNDISREPEPVKTITSTGILQPPPGFFI